VPPSTYRDAVRLQTSVLAAAEKRLLVRMARRLPGRVNSDHLTVLGGLAMVGAGACYWLSASYPPALWLVVVCLAVNWFGDSLDGTVARVRNCQRPRYGFYVDHVLDTLGVLFILAGLGLSGHMTPIVAVVVLAAYYLLSIEIYLATSVLATFRMGFAGLGPTELRILLAIGTLALFDHSRVTIAGHSFLLFDVGGTIAAAGMTSFFLASAASNARALYKEEPLVGKKPPTLTEDPPAESRMSQAAAAGPA
jgi:archaetidylinositol phosphate synthase